MPSCILPPRKPQQPPRRASGGAPLPEMLLQRVNLVCALERWPGQARAEWLAVLSRQLARDGVPAAELAAALDAHLAIHASAHAADHEAFEERAAILEFDGGLPRAEAELKAARRNDCQGCRHWRGEATLPDARQRAAMLVGLAPARLGNATVGVCAARYRPWRASNIAGEADYLRWHYIGECSREPAATSPAAAARPPALRTPQNGHPAASAAAPCPPG
ncbi:hypothetical protein [Chromobacterium alticapitis]|uniref:Uncharacterized protein n=1 Tax=Chromobacterium alticapitis TaxID=2073169 RepID=A0A2S5DLF1_9NEIS|nr:hypothetical protein [Chromobacterium alticapitis]POZ63895.1 hypothetical protein C2I19_00555 [Chromobacterium alticapitis]